MERLRPLHRLGAAADPGGAGARPRADRAPGQAGAGRVPHRRAGLPPAAAAGGPRRPGAAPRDRDAGGVGARGARPRRGRPRLGHRQRRDRDRAGDRGRGAPRDGVDRSPEALEVARGQRGGGGRRRRAGAVRRLRRSWRGARSTRWSPTRRTCPRPTSRARRRSWPGSRARRSSPGPPAWRRSRRSSATRPRTSSPGGRLLMEVGAGQAPAVVAMLRDAGRRARRPPATTWPGSPAPSAAGSGERAARGASGRRSTAAPSPWSPPTRSTAWRRRSTGPRGSPRSTP